MFDSILALDQPSFSSHLQQKAYTKYHFLYGINTLAYMHQSE